MAHNLYMIFGTYKCDKDHPKSYLGDPRIFCIYYQTPYYYSCHKDRPLECCHRWRRYLTKLENTTFLDGVDNFAAFCLVARLELKGLS